LLRQGDVRMDPCRSAAGHLRRRSRRHDRALDQRLLSLDRASRCQHIRPRAPGETLKYPPMLLSTESHPCARSDNSLSRPWCAARCPDLSGVQLGGRRPRGHTGQFRQDRCDGPRPHYGIHPPRFIDRGQPRAAELHAARLGGCKAGFSAVADHFAFVLGDGCEYMNG
jgi:hypothetical protein